jgi:hypothetical protein
VPGLDEVADLGQRPVDEEQVDEVEAELGQRPVERPQRVVAGVVGLSSLLVTNTSSRARPAARTARPTPASLPYICAVSTCR